MPIYIKTIENRDKEFRRIKEQIDETKFDGIVNNDRTSFKKIVNNMQDAFDLAFENDSRKSGTWNYADIIRPIDDQRRDIPYDTRQDENDEEDYDTYLRIESLSTVARLIIMNIFTESARDIFDDGCNEICPRNHTYIKVQYGMKALYEKYYQKSLFFGISLSVGTKNCMVFRSNLRTFAAIPNIGPNQFSFKRNDTY